MYENVIELVGEKLGPVSMVLVGVHGNERCGVDAVTELLSSIEIEKGRVFIAYGNPKAIEQNVRYTEANLNRVFKSDDSLSIKEKGSYEYTRAQFLKGYLDQADFLLDVHSSQTPNSKKFVICENNARDIAKYLPVSLLVSGFDNIEPGGTDYYMNQNGKVGICVECGYFMDPSSKDTAREIILAFLIACGNISGRANEYPQSIIEIEGMYLTKDSFALSKQFEDFEQVKKNQAVGTDGNEEVKMPTDGVILFARNRVSSNEEAFLYGKYKD